MQLGDLVMCCPLGANYPPGDDDRVGVVIGFDERENPIVLLSDGKIQSYWTNQLVWMYAHKGEAS